MTSIEEMACATARLVVFCGERFPWAQWWKITACSQRAPPTSKSQVTGISGHQAGEAAMTAALAAAPPRHQRAAAAQEPTAVCRKRGCSPADGLPVIQVQMC